MAFNDFLLNLSEYSHFIPVGAIIIIIVMILGYFIASDVKHSNYKKRKKEEHIKTRESLIAIHKEHEKFKEADLFECATGYFITISQSGYIGFVLPNKAYELVYHIKDINGFEVLKDGYSNAPDLGAAYAGKLFFGDVGAIIGGLGFSSKRIGRLAFIFKVNDFNTPLIEIEFLDSGVNTTSFVYESTLTKIHKILALLNIIEKKYKDWISLLF